MSRVLSLSLTDALYERVSEQAKSRGLTVYQYVRRAVEIRADEDEDLAKRLPDYYGKYIKKE